MRRWCCSRKRRNGKLWRALAGMTLDERVALAESGFRPTRYADLTAITLVGLVGRLVDRRPGQPHRARARLDTGMHVYDAELLRVRAHTYTNLDVAPPAFTPPANWPPPPLFELRAAIHDFESRGQPARAALIDTVRVLPADNVLPELAQPARYWFHPDRRAGSHPGRRHGLRRIETVVPEGFNRPRERRVLCFRANNGTNGPHGRQARRRAAAEIAAQRRASVPAAVSPETPVGHRTRHRTWRSPAAQFRMIRTPRPPSSKHHRPRGPTA